MRGVTLGQLVTDLRIEARLSLNPAHNTNDLEQQKELLRRTQDWLWEDFNWPHLRVERTFSLQTGVRFYPMPSDVSVDRIEALEAFVDGRWYPLKAGIGGVQYTVTNSDAGEQSWPPRCWRLTEAEGLEIWPVPNIDGPNAVKIRGIRNLAPLQDTNDTADLDDRMLVLFCAAERLAASGAKDASAKQQLALKRYAKLRGDLSTIRSFSIGRSRPVVRNRFGHLVCGVASTGSGSGGGGGASDGGGSGGGTVVVTVDGGNRG